MTSDDDEHILRAEFRFEGRRFVAEAHPNGSTTVTRDGLWLCNGNWTGRSLDCGNQDLHHDMDKSIAIIEALAAALEAADEGDFRLDPRKRGA